MGQRYRDSEVRKKEKERRGGGKNRIGVKKGERRKEKGERKGGERVEPEPAYCKSLPTPDPCDKKKKEKNGDRFVTALSYPASTEGLGFEEPGPR